MKAEMLCSSKSWLPPPPSECIAALNSPQCLAVSQFQCDVFTSRSHETGTGAFSAAAGGDRSRLAQRGGHTQTFQQRSATQNHPSRVRRPSVCSAPVQRPHGTFCRSWLGSDLLGTCEEGPKKILFFAEFLPPPGVFSTLNFTRERNQRAGACLQRRGKRDTGRTVRSSARRSSEPQITETFL